MLNGWLYVALTALTIAFTQNANAQGGPFGLGIQLGDPTAITGKYYLDKSQAIDGGISFDFNQWTMLYGDYLMHFPGGFGTNEQFIRELNPYVGIGGLLILSNRNDVEVRKQRYFSSSSSSKTALGVRIPLGIEWRTPKIPLGVFIELVPGITIIPSTNGYIQGGVGARYFF